MNNPFPHSSAIRLCETYHGFNSGQHEAKKIFRVVGVVGFLLVGSMGASLVRADTTNRPVNLRPVVVKGSRNFLTSPLYDVESESDRVGPANQPEWTTRRAFAETDIYVIPAGEIEINQFYVSSHPRHEKPENVFETEIEFGLPWRTQFDVEMEYSLNSGRGHYDETLLELPHALADWGKIPLNPAIVGGWKFKSGEADAYFVGLLLAEELGERVHFGGNFVYKEQVGDDREEEYELNLALSYVALDRKLTLGLESVVEHEIVRHESETAVMVGPSVLYKPTATTHLGLVSLFGVTHEAPVAEVFVIFGIDFQAFHWPVGEDSEKNADSFLPFRRRR